MALTTREVGKVIIFDIEGDLALPFIEEIGLHRRVKDMLGAGKRYFLVNFAGVSFMDSTRFGELFAGYLSVQNAGGKITLLMVPPKIRLVFNITGAANLFEFFEDEEPAIKSFP